MSLIPRATTDTVICVDCDQLFIKQYALRYLSIGGPGTEFGPIAKPRRNSSDDDDDDDVVPDVDAIFTEAIQNVPIVGKYPTLATGWEERIIAACTTTTNALSRLDQMRDLTGKSAGVLNETGLKFGLLTALTREFHNMPSVTISSEQSIQGGSAGGNGNIGCMDLVLTDATTDQMVILELKFARYEFLFTALTRGNNMTMKDLAEANLGADALFFQIVTYSRDEVMKLLPDAEAREYPAADAEPEVFTNSAETFSVTKSGGITNVDTRNNFASRHGSPQPMAVTRTGDTTGIKYTVMRRLDVVVRTAQKQAENYKRAYIAKHGDTKNVTALALVFAGAKCFYGTPSTFE